VILVDTSVWSRHFRERDDHLVELLRAGDVAVHSWIVGELALGPGLRLDVLDDLRRLPFVPTVADDDLLDFVRLHALRGIGWVDAELLVSARRAGAPLWTNDRRLAEVAERFEIGWLPR
jgi:hypothetical protein